MNGLATEREVGQMRSVVGSLGCTSRQCRPDLSLSVSLGQRAVNRAIIKDHKKLVFGRWNYLKNSGEHPEYDTYDFDFISTVPGTREYRRLQGDYVLTENDIRNQTDFPDTVLNL